MPTKLGPSIRQARLAAHMTQEQLGRRLGLKGRSVHRWERDESSPTKRHQTELVNTVRAVSPAAADTLLAALTAAKLPAVQAPPAPPQPPPIDPAVAFETAVYKLADALDLPARRLRRPLARFFGRLQTAKITVEVAQQFVDMWLAAEQ